MTNIKTRLVDATIKDKEGNIIGGKENFEVPEFWSDRAGKIVAAKYATDDETSVLQIIDRVVNQITEWGIKDGYFNDGVIYHKDGDCVTDVTTCSGCDPDCLNRWQDWQKFKDDLKDILINQRAAFNSPVWFNVGVSPTPQIAACFIGNIEDTMEDILDHTKRAGNIFKSGSGIGVNVSKLRGNGEKLSNKGRSSGPISFMRMWDRSAGAIKSGGKNRRSAVLIGMDINHPDIEEFIECKSREELKAQKLIEAGVSVEEAYSTVDFQNANHSVVVSDKFMEAVERDLDWELFNRGDKKVAKRIKAKELLNKIATQAHQTGDPGLIFIDTANRYNTLKSTGLIDIFNPCAEVCLPMWGACNLCSINVLKYYDNDNLRFDSSKLRDDINILITAMDIMIDNAHYPTENFRKEAIETRPLGLGISNLGALLITEGLAYNSQEGRDYAEELMRLITLCATETSISLAKQLESFKRYEDEKENLINIFERITKSAHIGKEIREVGIRNCNLTCLPPTGTVSFMMDCDTSGIEPLFALKQIKQLSGGGTIEIVPKCVEDYKYERFVEDWNSEVLKTANEINWEDHILMTAALQKAINMSISKTINMPNEATVEDVLEAYKLAYETGCKGITIYRDGSKGLQPLTDANKKKVETKTEPQTIKEASVPVRNKLPITRKSKTHKFEIGGFEGYITVGLFEDGSPGELFIRASKQGSFVLGLLDSFATMVSLGLQYGVPLDKLVEKFKGQTFEPNGITMNPDIRLCDSVIDYVFKWIENEYILKKALKVQEEKTKEEIFSGIETHQVEIIKDKIESNSLSGGICTICGGLLQQIGSCKYCINCAESSGCS